MQKTSFGHKVLLIIFGVGLAVIFLEAGLRIAGKVVGYLQERHNHISFDANEYRILCLGESTTALGGEDSYPSQLAKILNAQGRSIKYTTINKGIISTTTDAILSRVDQNLDLIKPQLVVVMMGINDKVYMRDPYKDLRWESLKLFLKDLKVYKLAHLLYEHVIHRIRRIDDGPKTFDPSFDDDGNDQHMENFLKMVIAKAVERFYAHASSAAQYRKDHQWAMVRLEEQFAQESRKEASSACIELARRYWLGGSFQEARSILERASILEMHNAYLYQEWGELYLALGQGAGAQKAFRTALGLDPKNNDLILELARAYYQEHNQDAFLFYAGYLQANPQDYWGYIELARWLTENKHDDLAQSYLSRAIELKPDLDQAYMDLGQLYREQGREDLAKGYFQKSAQHRVGEYYPATLVNYSLILDKILSRHIKVIVMQYPLKDINPLKAYLGQRNGVIFVENRQNFKQALNQGGYGRYFKDNFAGDFGHCTREGNELIARNLVQVILNN